MAGEPNERQDGTQSRLRWARESSQYWQYGLGAVLNGDNIPLSLADTTDVKFYYSHTSHWITDSFVQSRSALLRTKHWKKW